jgi:hypothetical protein
MESKRKEPKAPKPIVDKTKTGAAKADSTKARMGSTNAGSPGSRFIYKHGPTSMWMPLSLPTEIASRSTGDKDRQNWGPRPTTEMYVGVVSMQHTCRVDGKCFTQWGVQECRSRRWWRRGANIRTCKSHMGIISILAGRIEIRFFPQFTFEKKTLTNHCF